MSKLSQSYTINLSSAASFDIYLEDVVDVISLIGTAGGNVQIQKAGGSTNVEGLMLTFKFAGDMATNTLTLFGEAIKYTGSKQWTATCLYRNSAWEVRVMPDFEEDQIIETSHIKDLNVTAGKLSASLDLTAKTLTNVNIGSGAIDGTVIGANSKAAVSTSALVADTAAINGGTIDAVVIGGVTPAAASFTTIGASGNITGNLVGNVTGAVTGNATTATTLAVARTIAGTAFNGSANIDISPENLLGVSAVAADLELLAGAASAGVSSTDILAIKDINSVMSVTGGKITLASDKGVDGIIYEPTTIITGTDSIDENVTHVFMQNTADATLTIPDAGTLDGKLYNIYNSGTHNVSVIINGASEFNMGTYSNTKASINIQPGNSITIISDGIDWEVVKKTGGTWTKDATVQGDAKIKIVTSAVLKPLLVNASTQILKMREGDIILSVDYYVDTVSGAAETLDVGADADLTGAGVDIDGFLRAANTNAVGVYSTNDVANTYSGALMKSGYFVCANDGYIMGAASADISGTGIISAIKVTYISG